MERLAPLLDDAQRSRAGGEKAGKRLVDLFSAVGDAENANPNASTCAVDAEILKAGLADALDRLFVHSKLEAPAQRAFGFLAALPARLTEAGLDGEGLAAFLARHAVMRGAAEDKTVRSRACLFLVELLEALGETPVEEVVAEEVLGFALNRLRDRGANVRAAAAKAAALLQAGEGEDSLAGKITEELVRRMSTDGSKKVRSAAVEAVALTEETIGALLHRVRDVSPEVRLAALTRLARDVDVKRIAPGQRVRIVTSVFKDPSEDVANLGAAMLMVQWLPRVDFNVQRLLALLDPLQAAGAPALVLRVLFTWAYARDEAALDELSDVAAQIFPRTQSDTDVGRMLSLVTQSLTAVRQTKVDFSSHRTSMLKSRSATMNVTPEGIFFLAQKLRFLRHQRGSEALTPSRRMALLEACAPTAAAVAELLETLAENDSGDESDEFMMEALLRCVPLIDVEEEGGRRKLLTTLQRLDVGNLADLLGLATTPEEGSKEAPASDAEDSKEEESEVEEAPAEESDTEDTAAESTEA